MDQCVFCGIIWIGKVNNNNDNNNNNQILVK